MLARAVSIAQIDEKSIPAYAVVKTTMNENIVKLGEEDPYQTLKHLYATWAYRYPIEIFEQIEEEKSVNRPGKILGKL